MTVLVDSASNLFALNQLRLRNTGFATATDQLSSGIGVRRPADDIAAFSVGSRLAYQARGFNIGSQNVQNGISLLNTADGGTRVIQDALARMRELAVQSANGAWTDQQRTAMQDEVAQLRQLVYDTVDGTTFDGLQVLRGQSVPASNSVDVSGVPFAVTGSVGGSTTSSPTSGYAFDVTQAGSRAEAIGAQPATVIPGGSSPVNMTISGPLGSRTFTFNPGDGPALWIATINSVSAQLGVTAELTDSTTTYDDGTLADPAGDGYLLIRSIDPGSTADITIKTDQPLDATGFSKTPVRTTGRDFKGTINGVPFIAAGLNVTAPSTAGGAAGLTISFSNFPPVGTSGTVHVFVGTEQFVDLSLQIQYAPNTGDEHIVDIPSFRVGMLDPTIQGTLSDLDVSTQSGAQAAVDVLDGAQSQVLQGRAQISAHATALEHELTYAQVGDENQAVAQSQIMDADVARQAASLVTSQVLMQAGLSAVTALRQETVNLANLAQSMIAGSAPSGQTWQPAGLDAGASA